MFVRAFATLACYLGVLCSMSVVLADDIEPGLWKDHHAGRHRRWRNWAAARVRRKCLTPDESCDLAKTFSPVSRTINSECAPLESSLVGGNLKWKLVCKGQLDMDS